MSERDDFFDPAPPSTQNVERRNSLQQVYTSIGFLWDNEMPSTTNAIQSEQITQALVDDAKVALHMLQRLHVHLQLARVADERDRAKAALDTKQAVYEDLQHQYGEL